MQDRNLRFFSLRTDENRRRHAQILFVERETSCALRTGVTSIAVTSPGFGKIEYNFYIKMEGE